MGAKVRAPADRPCEARTWQAPISDGCTSLEAKQTFTLEGYRQATAGVECRKDEGVIDETPKAYKDIEAVMAAQADLIEVVHTLKQVLCVKG